MLDNIENPEATTTTSAASPEVPLNSSDTENNVSLIFDGYYINGTIQGGDTSEIFQALEEVKELQAETNSILTNISVVCLLFVALLGIVIAQGFVKLVKKR